MWQRRAFLKAAGAGFAASLLPQSAEALARTDLVFATATQESPGRYGARVLTETGKLITNVDLPVRGHDVTYSPQAGRAVVFARRPGTFAVVFDPSGQAAPQTIASVEGRHIIRHGVFSTDGKLLYATENDFENGRGALGDKDVAGGYRRIGEFQTHGVGPHEVILLPDGKTFAIANGGIETHPDYGRSELNLDSMDPSLSFVDARDGSLSASSGWRPSCTSCRFATWWRMPRGASGSAASSAATPARRSSSAMPRSTATSVLSSCRPMRSRACATMS